MLNHAVSQPVESRAAKMVRGILESGRPLTYIRSAEEQRVVRIVNEVATGPLSSKPLPVWTWSLTEGMRRQGEAASSPATESPRAALDFILAHQGAAIFHLKDFHEPLRESSETRRRLRDVYDAGVDQGKFVIISSPVQYIPEELERSIIFLELRPPDLIELVDFLSEEVPGASLDILYPVARALQGLTLDEARYALRRAFASGRGLGPEALPSLLEEKRLLVNRSGVVEYIADGTNLGDVGGLEGLKTWLLDRSKLFEMRDSLDAEIVPKGLLLMGIPGCGKSLSVKAIAHQFKLPLYRVDMIEIFSGRHGKPEAAFVEACKMMEDMSPAVLWFDEIEMGITSSETGESRDASSDFSLPGCRRRRAGFSSQPPPTGLIACRRK